MFIAQKQRNPKERFGRMVKMFIIGTKHLNFISLMYIIIFRIYFWLLVFLLVGLWFYCNYHRHPVVSTRNFYWDGTDGVKIPQDGNRANKHRHVAMVHGHVWRSVCSVCATGARVARPVPCNS